MLDVFIRLVSPTLTRYTVGSGDQPKVRLEHVTLQSVIQALDFVINSQSKGTYTPGPYLFWWRYCYHENALWGVSRCLARNHSQAVFFGSLNGRSSSSARYAALASHTMPQSSTPQIPSIPLKYWCSFFIGRIILKSIAGSSACKTTPQLRRSMIATWGNA